MTEPKPAESERKGLRITRVYTRTGDDGTTALVGGQRVPKDDARIEAYGTVDELAAAIGWTREVLSTERAAFATESDAGILAGHLEFIQNALFTLGGDLATRVEDRHPLMPVVTAEDAAWLEQVCDAFNASLPPLKDFVLAGGSATTAAIHVARTIARRAERRVQTLARNEDVGPFAVVYLNRLSDALFVLARWSVHRMGRGEVIWRRGLERPAMPPAQGG